MSLARDLLKRLIPDPLLDAYRRHEAEAKLSDAAKQVRSENARGLPPADCGAARAAELAGQWLCRAQDRSTPVDGGVARHFSLNTGWSPSYPETTGYIVPTFFELARRTGKADYAERARRMVDWLIAIQMPDGAFQGGMITASAVPTTFNTGQILIGLAAAAADSGAARDLDAMHRAAAWLRDNQDDDGCWRRFPSPFTKPGEKTYETHVAWGLLEAERVAPGHGYGEAALRQMSWAAGNIRPNGWIADCCLTDPSQPLTHTLGYALRGFIEGYRFNQDAALLSSAITVGEGLRGCVGPDGKLPGRLREDWSPAVSWVCLTGAVQNAANFLDLHAWTGEPAWRDAGLALNGFVRRTMVTEGDPDRVGAVAGSFPVDGDYGRFEYLNWAAKFLIDAQFMELDLA
ncbi:MAG: hypothetical protein RIM84_24315 [Alphaproteobacteria bacterium]